MNQKITLRELSSQELELLLKDQKFNQLRPISCSECGNQTNFSRRVFEVKGGVVQKRGILGNKRSLI